MPATFGKKGEREKKINKKRERSASYVIGRPSGGEGGGEDSAWASGSQLAKEGLTSSRGKIVRGSRLDSTVRVRFSFRFL